MLVLKSGYSATADASHTHPTMSCYYCPTRILVLKELCCYGILVPRHAYDGIEKSYAATAYWYYATRILVLKRGYDATAHCGTTLRV